MIDSDYFGNLQVSETEKLNSYLPKFWKEIYEMNANNSFAGYTLDRMAQDLQQLIWDRFFDTCSEDMLTRYERFLGMQNMETDVEKRRILLKATWNGNKKISAGRIVETLRQFYGGIIDVDVVFTDYFQFTIHTLNPDAATDRSIDLYLQKVLPAHIAYNVVYDTPIECRTYTGGAMVVGEILEIRQVF